MNIMRESRPDILLINLIGCC
uniref:Uncharacterized protein n=1 Tax=Rhizophora mucronata TaxID=61149 RepID=A0A2P2PGZ9_RHIMU